MRACAVLSFAVLAATPAFAENLIYRVDSATAAISGKRMIVTAKGAVKSGGAGDGCFQLGDGANHSEGG